MASLSLPSEWPLSCLTFGVLTAVLILMTGLIYAWRFHQVRTSERRIAGRRRGQPVAVEMALVAQPGTNLTKATVIDRSLNGLGLLTIEHMPTGTQLDIRPQGASVDMPWARMEVISAVKEGQAWRLGCAFVVPPAWVTLRTFG